MKHFTQKVVTLILALCIVISTAPSAYAQDDPADSPDLSNAQAAVEYLNAYYREGEAGTEYLYGSDADKDVIEKLAGVILEGSNALEQEQRDPARLFSEWVRENIKYIQDDAQAASVPESAIDTFYRREARCFGIAQLISQLLRTQDIPAAVGVGRRARSAQTPDVISESGDLHAWVYVYDAQAQAWSVYDPCFNTYDMRDIQEIASYYYLEEIEGVTPVCEGVVPDTGFYWTDGTLMKYKDGQPAVREPGQDPVSDGKKTRFVIYRGAADESGALMSGPIDTEEGYRVLYGRTNGILRLNDVYTDGDDYLVYSANGTEVRLTDLAGSDLYYWSGRAVVKEEASFTLKPFPTGYTPAEDEVVVFESDDPSVLDIDTATGEVQALSIGTTMLRFTVKDAGIAGFERYSGSIPVRVTERGLGDSPSNSSGEEYEYGREYVFSYNPPETDPGEEETHEHVWHDVITPAGYQTNGELWNVCDECGSEMYASGIAAIDSIELSSTAYYYNGRQKTPSVIIKAGSKTLQKGTDYTLQYPQERTEPGTYTVRVALQGYYTGTHSLSYQILRGNAKKVNSIMKSLGEKTEAEGSEFGKLRARIRKATDTSLTIRWNRVRNATSYAVYASKCGGKTGYKKVKTINGNKTTTYTQKKLKKAHYYRYIVVAYGNENGNQEIRSISKAVHAVTNGAKSGNSRKVTVPDKEKKITLKAGGAKTLHPKRIVASGKKAAAHRRICFESANKKVATVTSKGKIKAVAAGTATIYCYAHDGIYQTVKVTVK